VNFGRGKNIAGKQHYNGAAFFNRHCRRCNAASDKIGLDFTKKIIYIFDMI